MTDVRDPALFSSFSERFRRLLPTGQQPVDTGDSGYDKVIWAESNRSKRARVTARIHFDHGDPLPPSRRGRHESDGAIVARWVDVVLSAALILFLLPVLAVVALLVFVTDPGPVLFAHERQGRDGGTFKCLKFRTMVRDADTQLRNLLARDPAARVEWSRDHKLRDDPRITKIGSFLRRSSLDELPQLFNVLLGDMSLVGPRPIVAAEVPRYGRYISHYYRIRPGITGLWQISGRNNVSYRRRVALDVVYARRRSATLNFHILMMTLPSVLRSKGAF